VGNANVTFISNTKELLTILDLLKNSTLEKFEGEEFFFRDESLPRWRDLLASLACRRNDSEIATRV